MTEKVPRPAAPSEPCRAREIEGVGDAFNSQNSKTTHLHQGWPVVVGGIAAASIPRAGRMGGGVD
jgi:hypothetical protein